MRPDLITVQWCSCYWKKVSTELKADDGYTALALAAEFGQKETVQLLIDKKADGTAKVRKNGWTVLHCAARYNHKAVVQLLLEKGTDVNSEATYGKTALSFAAADYVQVVIYLFHCLLRRLMAAH